MKIKIFIGIIIISILIILGWFLLAQKKEQNTATIITQPIDLATNTIGVEKNNPPEEFFKKPTEKKLSFQTNKGEVLVNNFYTNAVFINSSGGSEIKKMDSYSLYYIVQEKRFAIYIASSDIIEAQKSAENDILNILGITKADACKLGIFVFIDKEYNFEGVGRYPLSFCASFPN